jgi:hypothetical protein
MERGILHVWFFGTGLTFLEIVEMEMIEAVCAFTGSLVKVRIRPDQDGETIEAFGQYGNIWMTGYLEPFGPDATEEEGPYEFMCDKFMEDVNEEYAPTGEEAEMWDYIREHGWKAARAKYPGKLEVEETG